MSTIKTILLAGAVSLAPAHAYAAPKEAPITLTFEPAAGPDSPAALDEAKAKMQREMDQAIAMVETIFEVDKLPPIDPGQLALAQKTTTALVAPGSIEKMLDNLYGKLFRAFMNQTDGLSDMMLSIKTGVDGDTIAALDAPSKAAIGDLFDPHRKEREERISKLIKPLISEVLRDLEPPMRNGLARAYARTFNTQQLGDFNAFLATPSGRAYAGEWMALQADPEVVIAMVKGVPPLINKFIDRAPQLEGQMKDLPKERSLTDLDDAELTKLASLMKVDVTSLVEHRDMLQADDAAAAHAAAEAADAAAGTDHGDAAFDRSNWSDADLKRVEALEAAADAASSAAFDAEQEAAANARKRLIPTT